MMKRTLFKKKKYNAGVALPTVVLISSILLIGGLGLVAMSIDVRKSSKSFSEYVQASMRAEVCLEESIQVLKYDPAYTGNFNLSFPTGECDSVISNIGIDPNLKEVVITSDFGASYYEKKYEVDVSDYPITISEL